MAKYDSQLDLLFTALSDPTRRAILTCLSSGESTITTLAAQHDMALPSFLKHLRKLEEAGLITTTKIGRVRVCKLSPYALRPVQSWLDGQQTLWEKRLNQLDDYALQLKRNRNNES